jgi:toluene monooxygenase system protein E
MNAPKLRTWSQLSKERRIPSEYEVVTHNLHYNKNLRFELDPNDPVVEWYRKYREESAIQANSMEDWDRFRDPQSIVYRAYTELQDERETFIDVLFEQDDELREKKKMDEKWLSFMLQSFTPLRYVGHGLQMMASYGAMISPSSYITNCFHFQAGDEMRRIQRIVYRTKQLQTNYPDHGFVENERSIWENDPMWQPLRETIERMMIEYDWGKSFTALNLVLKPLLDELVLVKYAELFRANDDDLIAEMLENLYLDTVRSKEWSIALAKLIIELKAENKAVMQDSINHWYLLVYRAILALAPAFESLPPHPLQFKQVLTDITSKHKSLLEQADLSVPTMN